MAYLALSLGAAAAAPDYSNAYLSVRVSRPGQSEYETDVSRQQVRQRVVTGEEVVENEEPFQDHVPPFLAFNLKPRPYEPAPAPAYKPVPTPAPYKPTPAPYKPTRAPYQPKPAPYRPEPAYQPAPAPYRPEPAYQPRTVYRPAPPAVSLTKHGKMFHYFCN